MIISGKALLAGVMGWPVSHLRSPRLHNYWLEKHNIDGAYLPFAVNPKTAIQAFQSLPALGIRGVNVTVPHKEIALQLCDHVDDLAQRIGAVNTIVVTEEGRLSGTNTDGFGFMENLRDRQPQWQATGPAVIIGAGGAARAILVALLDSGVPEIRITNRTRARAEELAATLNNERIRIIDWDQREDCLADADLLVNTTTLGMTGHLPLSLDIKSLPLTATVYDIVYAPLKTALLQDAAERGHPTVDGIGMLLHQARPGFKAWFGIDPVVDDRLRQYVLEDRTS